MHCRPSSPATGTYSFSKIEMGLYTFEPCNVCTDTGPPALIKSHLRRLGDVQFNSYLRGFQQKERLEWNGLLFLVV